MAGLVRNELLKFLEVAKNVKEYSLFSVKAVFTLKNIVRDEFYGEIQHSLTLEIPTYTLYPGNDSGFRCYFVGHGKLFDNRCMDSSLKCPFINDNMCRADLLVENIASQLQGMSTSRASETRWKNAWDDYKK